MADSPELFAAFDRAMELDEAERKVFLSELAGSNPEYAQRVGTLINQYAQERSFFESPLLPRLLEFDEEPTEIAEQTRIGAYCLVHMLGRGGMGSVWLADRADGEIKMQAAVKLVKQSLVTPEFIERFKRERQIVADLRHPHIAAFYDAGTTESGQPYLVMEYVEGLNIDRYCQEQKPDTARCLFVFRKICEAVDHAHRQGILHRDIKPGNIMVAKNGEPKLLDFGIARPIFREDEKITKPGQSAMTPEYAAPEILAGQPAGVAGDIYALGLVLANMLTGKRPNDLGYDKAATISGILADAGDIYLAELLIHALAGKVEDRYGSVAQMIHAIDDFLGTRTGSATSRSLFQFDALIWYSSDEEDAVASPREILEVRYGLSFSAVDENDHEALRRNLAESACLLVILGQGRPPWENQQIRLVIEQGVQFQRVTPVLLSGANRPKRESEIPSFLRRRAWLGPFDDQSTDSMETLSRAIRGLSADTTTRDVTDTCPFRGLAVFSEENERFFFGRESLVQMLNNHLAANRFMAVLGPSGSGKSSLVQAGMLPHARRQGFVIGLFTPSSRPVEEFAYNLSRMFPEPGLIHPEQLCARMRADSRAAGFVARELCDAAGCERILLVVDQFEEIFTLTREPGEADCFIANLLQAIEMPCGLSVVLTMRSDFVGKCVSWPDLNTYVTDHFMQVGPMARSQLLLAVTEPARLAGLRFEEGLVDRIVDDVCGAAVELPLLEHALLELWQRRRGRLLTFAAYQYIGGIEGALTRRAETEYEQLNQECRLLLRKIFTLCLVHPLEEAGDTRRRASREEILNVSRDVGVGETLLQRFVSARLLTIQRDDARQEDMVDVAHEALIRSWERVRNWMLEDRETARRVDRLRRQSKAWEESGRDQDHLPRGGPLFQMAELLEKEKQHLGDSEKDYVAAGLMRRESTRRRKQRIRNLVMAAGILGVFLAVIAFAMFFKASQAEGVARDAELIARKERDTAEQKTLEANYNLALAYDMYAGIALDDDNPQEAWLLSLAALSQEIPEDRELPEPMGRLLDPRMAEAERMLWSSPAASPLEQVANRPDGSQLALAGRDRVIRIIDTATGIQTKILGQAEHFITDLIYSPDDRMLAAASDNGEIYLWKTATGEFSVLSGGHETRVNCLAFSSDGTLLVSGGQDGRLLVRSTEKDFEPVILNTGSPIDDVVHYKESNLFFVASAGVCSVLDPGTGTSSPLAVDLDISTLTLGCGSLVCGGKDGGLIFLDPQDFKEIARIDTEPVKALAARGEELVYVSPETMALLNCDERIPKAFPDTGSVVDVSWSAGGVLDACREDGSLIRLRSEDGAEMAAPVGHGTIVNQLIVNKGGDRLVTASIDMTFLNWQLDGRAPSRNKPEGISPRAFSVISPDGNSIASCFKDYSIRLWDPDTGEILEIIQDDQPGASISFSANGRFMASTDYRGAVKIWDLIEGGDPRIFSKEGTIIQYAALDPTGSGMLTSTRKRSLLYWNLTDKTTKMLGNGPYFRNLLFDSDGKWFFAGVAVGVIQKWKMPHFEKVGSIQSYSQNAIDLSSDERWLATANQDGFIRIFDTQTLTEMRKLRAHINFTNRAAFLPDDRIASVSADSTVKLWDLEHGHNKSILKGHTAMTNCLAFSPDGRILASTSIDGTVRLWDILEGSHEVIGTYPKPTGVVSFSPDGRRLAVGTMADISLLDLDNRANTKALTGQSFLISSVKFTPDGKHLISSAWDKTVAIWDVETGTKLEHWKAHNLPVSGLALYPDGTRMVTAGQDRVLKIWDLDSKAELQVLRGHASQVFFVAISSDGSLLASSGHDRAVRIWDGETGEPLFVLRGHTKSVDSLVFSPDNKYLVSSGLSGSVRIWDPHMGRMIANMTDFEKHVNYLAFSPDSRYLAMSEGDNVLIWDMDRFLFPPSVVDNRKWYAELLKRSLMHFGYRLDGFRLFPQPRIRFGGGDVPLEPSAYDHLDKPRPRDTPFVEWLMTGYGDQ